MKLRSLHLDAFVPIPGYAAVEGSPKLERAKDFSVEDGWEILEVIPGVFSLLHESMTAPVVLGGYGYSYARSLKPETFEEGGIKYTRQIDPTRHVGMQLEVETPKPKRKR